MTTFPIFLILILFTITIYSYEEIDDYSKYMIQDSGGYYPLDKRDYMSTQERKIYDPLSDVGDKRYNFMLPDIGGYYPLDKRSQFLNFGINKDIIAFKCLCCEKTGYSHCCRYCSNFYGK